MKHSIRTKMYTIFLITTALSFLFTLLCFNLIMAQYIRRESIEALQHASASADRIRYQSNELQRYAVIVPESDDGAAPSIEPDLDEKLPDAQLSEEPLPSAENGAALIYENMDAATGNEVLDLAFQLYSGLLDDGNKEVGFLFTDLKNGDLLYPLPTVDIVIEAETEKQNAAFYDKQEIESLRSYFLEKDANQPTSVKLNGVNYYALEKPLTQNINIVFYKNNQQLRNLIQIINIVLLTLLGLFGAVIVIVVMRLTNGLVYSINKLCRFANDIGNGFLGQKKLNLKESEFAVLENDMNRMAKKLSEYDTEQKTFYQNVSHELKTPLMSIQGYAEGITSRLFQGEKAQKAAGIILAEGDRLSAMIDNLLCLSHLDSKDRFGDRTDFDCTETLKQLLSQANGVSGEKELTYNQRGGTLILHGNREAFEKAVMNLLTNAVRYAKKSITVTCDASERTIRIADDGPGISETDMPYIFQRFYKGAGGQSGLGLAITQTAIRAMGGSITAENNHGAVFTIFFPPPDGETPTPSDSKDAL